MARFRQKNTQTQSGNSASLRSKFPKGRALKYLLRSMALLLLLPVALAAIYIWNPAVVLVAGFETASFLGRHGDNSNDCTGQWSPGLDADNPYLIPFFPEAGARYHVMVLDAARDGRPVELRISGNLPRARYASFHAYDAETGAILGAIADTQFAPNGGNFAFSIRQDEATASGLTVPKGASRIGLVWRLYLPASAITELPQVRLHDAQTGEPVSVCRHHMTVPQTVSDPDATAQREAAIARILALSREMQAAGDAWPVRFYARHPRSAPYFANQHVVYAFGLLERKLGENVLVTFRLPMAAKGLRYWSVCLSGLRETSTSRCLADADVKVGLDGQFKLLIGPQDKASRARAAALGYNHFGWGWFTGARVLIVRQLFHDGGADFEGSFARIPDFNGQAANPLRGQFADANIGASAPVARYCSTDQLLGPGGCMPAVGG